MSGAYVFAVDDEHVGLRVSEVVAVVALLLDHLAEEDGRLLLDDLGHAVEAAEERARVEGEARRQVAGDVRPQAAALIRGAYEENRLRDVEDASLRQLFHEETHVCLDEVHVAVVRFQLAVASILWYDHLGLRERYLPSNTLPATGTASGTGRCLPSWRGSRAE